MKKSYSKKSQIWLVCIICFLFAVLLSVTITAAYFGKNRNFSGTLEFSPGIKIYYGNVKKDASGNSFSLMKLGNSKNINRFNGAQDLTPLDESSDNVSSEEIFYIANPRLKPASESIEYFVRLKIDFTTTEYENGVAISERNLTSEEILNVFGVSDPLEINGVSETKSGFVKLGDYYYLIKANESEVSYTNLLINKDGENSEIFIFETKGEKQNIKYFELTLAETVDYYLVDNFKIKIVVEAIDARENSGAIQNDVWNING